MRRLTTADQPFLSVIVPAYRGERWIGEALGSVADQVEPEDRDGVELLIVDSCPDSATLDIARGFADRLTLRLYERRDLAMWHAKTNFATNEARARHVCWLHQDDLWMPGRLRAVKGWIAQAPEAALHVAPSLYIDANGDFLGRWTCPFDIDGAVPQNVFLRRLLVQNFIAAPAPVFRKDAWLLCGGLDETLWYTADWDVWINLAVQGEIRFHNEPLTAFRVHGSSLTVSGSRHVDDFIQQLRIVFERHISLLSNEAREEIAPLAEASMLVNAAVARAGDGDLSGLPRAAAVMISLGRRGLSAYLRDSRIVERVGARVRAKMKGSM